MEPGTSKEAEEIALDSSDEEEGSGSDEREENSPAKKGEEGEDDLGESSEEDEDEEDEDESEEDEDEESEESDGSDDSVWESFENSKTTATQEANEATALQEFHSGLECIVAGKKEKAVRIFKRILKNPLVSGFHKKIVDWDVETDDKLSKMARLFVGCHKNLATLEKDKAEEHYIQVLSIAPLNNSSTWLDLGFCTFESGDLTMAKYAFGRAESDEGRTNLISVLFLRKEYHACLEHIKTAFDAESREKLFYFLKEKIRGINDHYRQFHDSLFQEDHLYDVHKSVLMSKDVEEFTERIRVAEEALQIALTKAVEPAREFDPIEVEIVKEQPCDSVLTIFCDMFDRIEAYSSLARQRLDLRNWEDRQMHLDCESVLHSMLDVVDVTYDLVDRVWLREEVNSPTPDKSLRDRRKSLRLERSSTTPALSTRAPSICAATSIPETELASLLHLEPVLIVPLCTGLNDPSRTPSPFCVSPPFDENLFLAEVRQILCTDTPLTMFEIIKTILLRLAAFCPKKGAVPVNLLPVVRQLYRRLNLMCSDLSHKSFLRLHVLMDDLGEPSGRDYCIRWNFNNTWPVRGLAVRFAWNCARYSTKESVKLAWLDQLAESMKDGQLFSTAADSLSIHDVQKYSNRIRKNERIRSIEVLIASNLHDQVVAIMKKDIDFDSVEDDEFPTMIDNWLTSLFALGMHEDAAELLCRVFQHVYDEYSESTNFDLIEKWLPKLELDKVSTDWLKCLGFCLCFFVPKKASLFLWLKLYEVVKHIEGPPSVAYLETLENDEALPWRPLDVLGKAHESLGTSHQCSSNHGEFLKFMMKEFNLVLESKEVRDALYEEDNAWLLVNFNEEVSQCLHCYFGRFSKKRKQMADHGIRATTNGGEDIADFVLSLAIPRPLPCFEDKERLGHDVTDLVTSRFAWFLKLDDARHEIINELKDWLYRSNRKMIVPGRPVVWPQKSEDSELKAKIWYLMALTNYRQNNHDDTRLYAELFLTCKNADFGSRVTLSAWFMLAHAIACETFKMPIEKMIRFWEWRTMPYRIGIAIDASFGVVHFQLANTLYQMATLFHRFISKLPIDNFNRRYCPKVRQLHHEAREHFKIVVTLPPKDCRVEEFQWLSFFFLGKLHRKRTKSYNIVKVVDNFFEAACSCELGDFFWYPVKITKKQQNLEPVELHYQLYAAIWKYIRDVENPPTDTLVSLLAYARAFKSHKVVKSGNSLFTVSPEVHETVLDTVMKASRKDSDGDEIRSLLDSVVERVEILEELWNLCYKAFELVCDRFPHPKAYYRLAEMEFRKRNLGKAHDYLLKGALRRRKKEDGFFDNYLEFTSNDIERSGSFSYHIERTVRLTVQVLREQGDIATLLQMLHSFVSAIGEDDESCNIQESARGELCYLVMISIETCAKDLQLSPKQVKPDIARTWQRIEKYPQKSAIMSVKRWLAKILEPQFGDIDRLVAEQVQREETTRKLNRKRRNVPPVPNPIAPRQPGLPQLQPDLPQIQPVMNLADPMQLINMMLLNSALGHQF